jgi:type II secretory pathway component PulF
MPRYLCRLADENGAVLSEFREAEDEASLLRAISQSKRYLLSYEQQKGKNPRRRYYSERVVMDFTRTLAVLLQAGLSLENALDVACDIFKGNAAGELVERLLEGVRKGESFSRSLESLGGTFPPVYRGMVRIGERTGHLEPMFVRIAAYIEEQKRLSDTIKGALIYPSLVLSVVALMLIGIAFFLVPALRNLFGSMGSGLPPHTAAAMRLMDIFAWALVALGAVAAGASIGIRVARGRGSRTAEDIDRMLLRIPLLGRYTILRESLSFSFAMETLVSAGIALEDALQEAASVLTNKGYAADLAAIRNQILEGGKLSAAFASRPSFPREFARWAAVGERTGSVESIFAQTKAFFQYDLDRWTKRFMALIEPALIMVVGAILIVVIILFVLPFLTSFTEVL